MQDARATYGLALFLILPTLLKPVALLSDSASVRSSASAAASASSAVSGFGGSGPKPSASRLEISGPPGGPGIIMATGDNRLKRTNTTAAANKEF